MILDDILDKIYRAPEESIREIRQILLLEDAADIERLFSFAGGIRRRFMGNGVLLRGLIEFSNRCDNSCFYCGLNRHNDCLERYRMDTDEILAAVGNLNSANIKTAVLQSGEDGELDARWFAGLIREIKKSFNIAVTLSVGEKTYEEYKLWREAGADRYLLKIETTDPDIYAAAHDGRRIDSRLKCLDDLSALGYQTGSGIMIGLKGQTIDSIARDILFFRKKDFDMLGIGPFLPHPHTAFADVPPGNILLTLKTLAVTRIITRNAHLPATTALGSAGADYRTNGLNAGANVLMPNFTPFKYRKLYEIYPNKACLYEPAERCITCMCRKAESTGNFIDYSTGHSIKEHFCTT